MSLFRFRVRQPGEWAVGSQHEGADAFPRARCRQIDGKLKICRAYDVLPTPLRGGTYSCPRTYQTGSLAGQEEPIAQCLAQYLGVLDDAGAQGGFL